VIDTNHGDPLHPVIRLLDQLTYEPTERVNTALRDAAGAYERHISRSEPVPEGFDVRGMLEAA
jgi:hypothetical protein